MPSTYVGRFAPSPTGPLHYGSLVAAVASFLDARHHNGRWLLRIEDLDPQRESATAPAMIMTQLRAYGLIWDGAETYQSHNLADYALALSDLSRMGAVFHCRCSRKSVPTVYPGTCREKTTPPSDVPTATRLIVPDETIQIEDLHLGHQQWNLTTEVGDFIIRRKDTLIAYQLAVVVDDINQGVNHVIRGIDLLDSTPRQLTLYRYFKQSPPDYLHIPVIVGADGQKLSKQAHAKSIGDKGDLQILRCALSDLGQTGFDTGRNINDTIALAIEHWDRKAITGQQQLPLRSELC